MDKVLDAYALLAWLQDEPGASHVDGLLQLAAAGQCRLYASSINMGEVFYRLMKLGQRTTAARFLTEIQVGELPVRRVSATDARVDAAAKLKAGHPISYADAFAVALAMELQLPLLTNDPEIVEISRDVDLTLEWTTDR
jgi:ribonuclease VapC